MKTQWNDKKDSTQQYVMTAYLSYVERRCIPLDVIIKQKTNESTQINISKITTKRQRLSLEIYGPAQIHEFSIYEIHKILQNGHLRRPT